MDKTVFLITRLDCASEENMLRIKLDEVNGIHSLDFDITKRKLTVLHSGNFDVIRAQVDSLNFDASVLSREVVDEISAQRENSKIQSTLLWKVLLINLAFFVIEATTGLISRSMGLVADSLDMLADSIVYGLSLAVIGKAMSSKKRIAGISGYF